MNQWGWGSTYRTSNSEYGQFNHNFGQNGLHRRPAGQGQGHGQGSGQSSHYLMPETRGATTTTTGSINHQQSQFNVGLPKAEEEMTKMNHSQIPIPRIVNNQKSQMFSTSAAVAATTPGTTRATTTFAGTEPGITRASAKTSFEKVGDGHVAVPVTGCDNDGIEAAEKKNEQLSSIQMIEENVKLDEEDLKPVRATGQKPMMDITTLTGTNSSTATTASAAANETIKAEDQEQELDQVQIQGDPKVATHIKSQNQQGKMINSSSRPAAAGTTGIAGIIGRGSGDNLENSGSKFRIRKKYSDPQPIERKVVPTNRQLSKQQIDSMPKLVRGDYLEKSIPSSTYGRGPSGTAGQGDTSQRIFFKNEISGSDQKYKLCGKCPKCRSIKSQNLNYNSSRVVGGPAGTSPKTISGISWNSSTTPGTLTKSQLSRSKVNLRSSLPSASGTLPGPSVLHLNDPRLRR